jgi:hypothetical protein
VEHYLQSLQNFILIHRTTFVFVSCSDTNICGIFKAPIEVKTLAVTGSIIIKAQILPFCLILCLFCRYVGISIASTYGQDHKILMSTNASPRIEISTFSPKTNSIVYNRHMQVNSELRRKSGLM